MTIEKKAPASRETYRHGDLRRALLEAGIELARKGGPEAVTLREATRRAGVVPNAAYRHFTSRDDLLRAVRAAAVAAMARAIEAELAAIDSMAPAVERARAGLRAIGTGYLRFAMAEPGLFRTGFAVPDPATEKRGLDKGGASGLDPFQLLGTVLDKMVEAGLMPSARRPDAEYSAWSTVHGFAMLVIEGPLHVLPESRRNAIGLRLIDMVERGL